MRQDDAARLDREYTATVSRLESGAGDDEVEAASQRAQAEVEAWAARMKAAIDERAAKLSAAAEGVGAEAKARAEEQVRGPTTITC